MGARAVPMELRWRICLVTPCGFPVALDAISRSRSVPGPRRGDLTGGSPSAFSSRDARVTTPRAGDCAGRTPDVGSTGVSRFWSREVREFTEEPTGVSGNDGRASGAIARSVAQQSTSQLRHCRLRCARAQTSTPASSTPLTSPLAANVGVDRKMSAPYSAVKRDQRRDFGLDVAPPRRRRDPQRGIGLGGLVPADGQR